MMNGVSCWGAVRRGASSRTDAYGFELAHGIALTGWAAGRLVVLGLGPRVPGHAWRDVIDDLRLRLLPVSA